MNKIIRNKILNMVKADQTMRKSGRWESNIDKKNTLELKNIIQKHGWPDIDLVGKKGTVGAWLIAQHADHDVKFQEKCLRLMKEKIKKGKVLSQHSAYLIDRVKVNKGLSQIYGTQFYLNRDGCLVPRRIYDKKNLDQRRKKVGLENFTRYQARLVSRQNKLYKK